MSGEEFKFYPAILINRDLIEKTVFDLEESLILNFFLIGNENYKGYVLGFFEQLNSLMGFSIKCDLIEVALLKKENKGMVKTRIVTPFVIVDLTEQAEYYLRTYEVALPIKSNFKIVQSRSVFDKRRFVIDRKTITTSGIIGELMFDAIDSRYFTIGIGKSNFIGGGQINEIEN